MKIEQIKKLIVSEGYIIPYRMKLPSSVTEKSALQRMVTFTTDCFSTANELSSIYTEGYNLGVQSALKILERTKKGKIR